MNLQIVSGDFPDFIPNVKFPDYYAYAQQGLLAEIPVDMIKSEAPTIASWIEDNLYGESSWDYYAIDGKNYIVPSIWTIGPAFNTMVIRQDMLEEAGVTKLPDTLEEWEAALLKIKETKNIAPMMGAAGFKGIYDCVFGEMCIRDRSGSTPGEKWSMQRKRTDWGMYMKNMDWWEQGRFGMFIHFGIYTVTEGAWEGEVVPTLVEWMQFRKQIPLERYRQLAEGLTLEKFDAREYVRLAKAALSLIHI